MSLQQVPEASLEGYGAPLYPTVMYELAEALTTRSRIGVHGSELERVASALPGFERACEGFAATTGDAYVWYRILAFQRRDRGADGARRMGHVAIAIPWAKDEQMSDGSSLDRLPAGYASDGDLGLAGSYARWLTDALLA